MLPGSCEAAMATEMTNVVPIIETWTARAERRGPPISRTAAIPYAPSVAAQMAGSWEPAACGSSSHSTDRVEPMTCRIPRGRVSRRRSSAWRSGDRKAIRPCGR